VDSIAAFGFPTIVMSQQAATTVPWPSEREVADQVVIDADPAEARRALESVPLWFHTFALNRRHNLYTPGKARDHGYRLASIPQSFAGMRVLDLGAFDGFYSFLAEARGAGRVVAIDNEQYVHWVKSRWNVTLAGGEGFRAIKRLLDSEVEYLGMDAFELDRLDEQFDLIFCFGILHRVENPLGLLRLLGGRLAADGCILVETYGVPGDRGAAEGALYVPRPGELYPGDGFVYWQFSSGTLGRLATFADLPHFQLCCTPIVDGHPRILGRIGAEPFAVRNLVG
jgi:tRNA (mo5U34)-methyltransferase